jgi:molybdopterin synthase catalytic subunit
MAGGRGRPGGLPDSFRRLRPVISPPTDALDWVTLTDAALPVETLHAWAVTPRSGAVVCFVGVVRDHADGRDDVRAMTYEAYEEPALRVMGEIAAETRRRWPEVERIALLHRVGELALSEPSVAVAVSSPHRDDAFDAARYCIDTLKETVPIWKQEHWGAGSDWALGEKQIRPVAATTPSVSRLESSPERVGVSANPSKA